MSTHPPPSPSPSPSPTPSFPPCLLLLSDSALPLGSFAYSSGLESYLAHHPHSPTSPTNLITQFLTLSLTSFSTTLVPYLIAAYNNPSNIVTLDNDLDASTTCTVARRASIAQGRALVVVWERALREPTTTSTTDPAGARADDESEASKALSSFSTLLRKPPPPPPPPGPLSHDPTPTEPSNPHHHHHHPPPPLHPPSVNGHFAPLFGIVSAAQGIPLMDAVWIFLFSHARGVLSAAVRKGVMGPYQAQGILAGGWLRGVLGDCAARGLGVGRLEDAGQSVVMVDVWGGRHEVLYTRIFNS